jgi:hypothetical protein
LDVQTTGCSKLEQTGFATCATSVRFLERAVTSKGSVSPTQEEMTAFITSQFSSFENDKHNCLLTATTMSCPRLKIDNFAESSAVEYVLITSSANQNAATAAATAASHTVGSAQLAQQLQTSSVQTTLKGLPDALPTLGKELASTAAEQLYELLVNVVPAEATYGQRFILGEWIIELRLVDGIAGDIRAIIVDPIKLRDVLPSTSIPDQVKNIFEPIIALQAKSVTLTVSTVGPPYVAVSGLIALPGSGVESHFLFVARQPTNFRRLASGMTDWEWSFVMQCNAVQPLLGALAGAFFTEHLGAIFPENAAVEFQSSGEFAIGTASWMVHGWRSEFPPLLPANNTKLVTPDFLNVTFPLGGSSVAISVGFDDIGLVFAATVIGDAVMLKDLLSTLEPAYRDQFGTGQVASFLKSALDPILELGVDDVVFVGRQKLMTLDGTLVWGGKSVTVQFSTEYVVDQWEFALAIDGVATSVTAAIKSVIGDALSDYIDLPTIVGDDLALMLSSLPSAPIRLGTLRSQVSEVLPSAANGFLVVTDVLKSKAIKSINSFVEQNLNYGWEGKIQLFGELELLTSLDIVGTGMGFAATLSNGQSKTITLRTALTSSMLSSVDSFRDSLKLALGFVSPEIIDTAVDFVLDMAISDVAISGKTSPPTLNLEAAVGSAPSKPLSLCVTRDPSGEWQFATAVPFDLNAIKTFIHDHISTTDLKNWVQDHVFDSQATNTAAIMFGSAVQNKFQFGALKPGQLLGVRSQEAIATAIEILQETDTSIEKYVASRLDGIEGTLTYAGISMQYSAQTTARGVHLALNFDFSGGNAPTLLSALGSDGSAQLSDASKQAGGFSAVGTLLTDKVRIHSCAIFLWQVTAQTSFYLRVVLFTVWYPLHVHRL